MTISTMTQSPLLEGLNPAQSQAVQHALGPLLVLAGAGSGKTRVLTHQIAFKLASGVYPGDILAVTFTNKAAKEMKARLQQLVGDTTSQWLWIGTFHSVCGRILRREISQYTTPSGGQWQQNFVVYDEAESLSVVKEAIKKLNLDDKLYNPKTTRYLISGLKNQLIDAYQYATEAKDFRTEKLGQIYALYESLMIRNNALDFDDMLLITVKVLQQHPEVLNRYHQKFKHILVDEFQDTNDVQYELVRLLSEGCLSDDRTPDLHKTLWRNRSLTVVGDVDQSIYSWRGANFRIILNFQEDFPDASIIKLLQNYRSTANILDVANAIIENNSDRIPKELRSVKGAGEKITCYEAKDDREEALYVIDRLLQLSQGGQFKPGQCCILYRTNVQSRVLEDVLISRGLPYTMVGGLKFYERREIKDVMAYLTVIFNDADNYSVKRVLNVPRRGVGKTSIEKLEQAADKQNLSLYGVLSQADQLKTLGPEFELKPKAMKAIASFVTLVESLKRQAASVTLDQLILQILDQSGYYDELKIDDPTDSEGRMANVEEFISVAKQFILEQAALQTDPEDTNAENQPDNQLATFLTQMALLSDIDSAAPAEDKFVLMTIHAAKGLEYPVVAICGLEESLFPHFRSLNDKEQMEEERRLMYVAVTRAEDKLLITYARRRMIMGEMRYSQPSRFLKEIPGELLSGFYTLDQESGYTSKYTNTSSRARSAEEGDWQDMHFQDEEPPNLSESGLPDRIQSAKPTHRKPNAYGGGGKWSEYGQKSSYLQNDKFSEARAKSKAKQQNRLKISAAADEESAAAGSASAPAFTVGQRVQHPKFGEGTVAQIIGEGVKRIYGIKFDTIPGQKLLDPKIAHLEAL